MGQPKHHCLQPASVELHYDNGAVLVVDPAVVGGVVWAEDLTNPHQDVSGLPNGVTMKKRRGRKPPTPPSCYWEGNQLVCC